MTDHPGTTDPLAEKADRLVMDTMRLVTALDAITARDLPDSVAEALRRGYVAFADLLIRRGCLTLGNEDELVIEWALDLITARLRFLRTLQSRQLPN